MDEEAVKPCIQDRFKKYVRSSFSRNNILNAIVMTTLIYSSFVMGIFKLFNIDAVRLLVEIEATILGFYGLIYTSILISMNSRLDRELILNYLTDDTSFSTYPHLTMENFNTDRERVRRKFTTIFFYIIISMIVGIASIALYNVELLGNLLFYFNIIGAYFFFYSFKTFIGLMR